MAYNFTNAIAKLDSTSPRTVYTAPTGTGNTAVVLSILVANVDGTNAADITVIITDNSDSELGRIAHTISVPADGSIELVPNKLILQAGQKLRAIPSAANDLDVTVSVMENV